MPYFAGTPQLASWRRGSVPSSVGLPIVGSSYSIFPLVEDGEAFHGNLAVSTIVMMASYNFTNTSGNPTAAWTSNGRIGLFTLNVSTLSLLNSASWSWGCTANAAISSNFNGLREMTIASSAWSVQPVLQDGVRYWVALQFIPTATTTNFSIYGVAGSGLTQTTMGLIGGTGGGTSSGTQMRPYDVFQGLFSATTNAMPTNIQESQVVGLTASALPFCDPWMRFDAGFWP